MTTNGSELTRIAWLQAFPFVRLFQTLRLSLGVSRLLLAFVAVVLCYFGGRVLDTFWGQHGGVVTRLHDGRVQREIEAYGTSTFAEYHAWLREAQKEQDQRAFHVLRDVDLASTPDQAKTSLAVQTLRELVLDAKHQQELTDLRKIVDRRLEVGLKAVAGDGDLSASDRTEKRRNLINAADAVNHVLSAARGPGGADAGSTQRVIELLLAADPNGEPRQRSEDQGKLVRAAARMAQFRQYERCQPRGTFISLLMYETRCFAGAIQGVCAGRWGFGAGAFDHPPAMCGSIESAARGFCWLLNQRPWYAVLFGLYCLVVFAYFGGAICRSAAVQAARDESIAIGASLQFVRQRFSGFLMAPLLPIAVFVGIGSLLFVGGLLGAIGYIGELATGLFYPLALLGGLALSVIAVVTVLSFHLMWPTIAVEGSDGFDALSRACSYVTSRIWHVGFYSFVLLLYGGIAFVIGRVVFAVLLKFAHKFTGLGMNLAISAESAGTGKLNAMWMMPAWADLSLLPSTGDTPFWGTFFNAPLDGWEGVGAGLLTLWVYLLITVLGAFVVSYYFCGSTQMYFLLRREVDATDFDDVYYEAPAEPAPAAAVSLEAPAAPTAAPSGEAPAAGESPTA
jgi:hypothetical protein